jgi:hypothetical protein
VIDKFSIERKLLMPYTLVVVDMQEEFSAANHVETIIAVEEAIIQAIQDYANIIFLEFIGCGRTMDRIYSLVDSYHQVFFLKKPSCDGSLFINRLNSAFNLQEVHFKIVGVNTDACVLDTVYGLNRQYPDSVIEVIEKAVNSDLNHHRGLALMKELKNIVITKDSQPRTQILKSNVN